MSETGERYKGKVQKEINGSAQELGQRGEALLERSASKTALLTGLIVGVCVVVSVVHWPALSAQVLFFDDSEYLTENTLVQNPSWASARRFFTEVLEPSTVHGYYQPLTMLSLMFDCALGGRADNLRQFHRTSLDLHVANTALVVVLLYLLFGQAPIAAAAGLLFGLHPMTVEPIPWVGERKTLLAAFFALWCLVLYVSYARKGSWKLFAGCVVAYVLALMAKPTTVPLPALLLLLDFWPLRRLSKRSFLEKIPLFGVGVIFAFITVVSQGRTAAVTMPGEYGPVRILLILCHNIVFYLYKIIRPVNLCPYYPFPEPLAISHPMILAGITGTVILLSALLVSLRRTRALLTGWLFFFTAILPTMGVIGFTVVVASDKYAYLPSVGLVMVLAWLLKVVWVRVCRSRVRQIIVVFFVLVLVVSEAVATRRYLARWQKTEILCEHLLSLVSNSPQVYSFAATDLVMRGKYDEAIEYYKKAIEIGSRFRTEVNYKTTVNIHYNLGVVLVMQNKLDEAIEHFYTTVEMRKSYDSAHYELANALALKGELDKAIKHYKQAVDLRPDSGDVHKNLAVALVGKGKVSEAIEHYSKAQQLGIDSGKGDGDLGNVLLGMGKIDEAILYYRKVVEEKLKTGEQFQRGFANARYNLATALQLQGEFGEAIGHYREVLQAEPDFAKAHYNLAAALANQGELDEAVEEYQQALQLEPGNVDALKNLALILGQQGKIDEVVEYYKKAIELEPQNVIIHGRLGLALAEQGKTSEAIKEFRIVLSMTPDDVEMRCNVGILLERQGKIDEAIEQYREALQINPEYTKASELLNAVLAKQRNR